MLLQQARESVGCARAFLAQTPPLLSLVLPEHSYQEANPASGILYVLADP